MKNINWSNIATIAIVSAVVGLILIPMLRPWAKKIPVVGGYVE